MYNRLRHNVQIQQSMNGIIGEEIERRIMSLYIHTKNIRAFLGGPVPSTQARGTVQARPVKVPTPKQ